MIIKGSTHTGKGLGAYLMQDKNDRAELLDIRGDLKRDLKETLDDWRSDSQGENCTKPLYHAQINPDRALSREEWDKAVSLFEKEMGFENQPRVMVLHEYKGREHLHLVYSRIDENGKAISDSWNYLHHEKAAREIERELGLEITQGALYQREGARPERTPDRDAIQQGERLKLDPKAVKAEVSELYQNAENGREFVAALDTAGYTLAQGDQRGYVILDQVGGVHSLSRMAGVKVAELRESLQEYNLQNLPTVEAVRERQQERQQAESAIKQESENEQVKFAPSHAGLSQEEREKRHQAHLAATLYDRGGMASQQSDALKDHAERQEKADLDWRIQIVNEHAAVFRAKPEGGAEHPTAQERQAIVEAFFDRQSQGIVNPELDQAAAAFLPREQFANAQHEATNRQNDNQSRPAQDEGKKYSTVADLAPDLEMTDSRAARLAKAEKYFEQRDAENQKRREREQGQGLGRGRERER